MPIIPVLGELRKEDFKCLGSQATQQDWKKKKKKKAGAWGLLVKYLPHKHGELNLVPQDPRKKPDTAVHT